MRIIGIDPGLARVGYGIIDDIEGKKIMLDCGIIETQSSQKEERRLLEISKDLSSIINKWDPKYAAVEKFFFYRSSTTISVVQARGVIMMTLGKHNLSIQEFPPMQIKLAVTGYGHSDKNEVLKSVMYDLNIDSPPKPDDAADALAIALTGIYLQ
ncbi:crossover junction endodeoxyribonuclease RuvC [Prochlorococcus marinus]|uniref:Crossover junction endodeoxyribonuclease RuvC n=1 Tax=Prochlorococcus marinus XMU1408 TaxID=2213228 RepID=A0A318R2D0_PROMR|nr:crossover junction endodeoxyribonuclease RuvC [Prochlorococcus marinus]MBW3042306.1 crossover junction endodeoxyribonuclease RuvC [Prochlorococcus marinus str. XMU1408]PYE01692.1 crossover junction endodeoxyribonuclease RuvC [Prochlorococcus marinus XMU1408]